MKKPESRWSPRGTNLLIAAGFCVLNNKVADYLDKRDERQWPRDLAISPAPSRAQRNVMFGLCTTPDAQSPPLGNSFQSNSG